MDIDAEAKKLATRLHFQPNSTAFEEIKQFADSVTKDARQPENHWAVTVSSHGDELITISSKMLCGKAEFSQQDEKNIRTAATHLLSFIGEHDCGCEENQ